MTAAVIKHDVNHLLIKNNDDDGDDDDVDDDVDDDDVDDEDEWGSEGGRKWVRDMLT